MKKFDLEKMHTLKRWLHSQLAILFKDSVKMIDEETESSSADTKVPMAASPYTFLTYAEHQKMKASWAEMEKHKAEAMQQFMRERIRYV